MKSVHILLFYGTIAFKKIVLKKISRGNQQMGIIRVAQSVDLDLHAQAVMK
jgi:hypothetical protein